MYARINTPIAYGDISAGDESIRKRARRNVEIEDLDDDEYDIIVEAFPEHGDKAAYLYTLIEGDTIDEIVDRIVHDGPDWEIDPGSIECGDREYWDHIWEQWTVEGDHVSEHRVPVEA